MNLHLAAQTTNAFLGRRAKVAALVIFVGALSAMAMGATVIPAPTAMAGGEGRAVLSPLEVATGGDHTCARLDNGQVKCWGGNSSGNLGLGDVINRGDSGAAGHLMGDALPAVNLGAGRTAVALAAAADHTCARLDNGQVKCWGGNFAGHLGLGDVINRGDSLVAGHLMGDALPAVNLGAGRTAVALAAGFDHTCARLDNGQVKCWGLNFSGQLGLGDAINRGDSGVAGHLMGDALPAVNLGAGRTAVALVAGGNHTCARLDNGQLKCWGYNSSGQLGLGDVVNRGDSGVAGHLMGDALPAVNLGAGRTAVALAAGGAYTCVRLDNGQAKCWGFNLFGQLGLGDVVNRGDSGAAGHLMGDSLPAVNLGAGRTAVALAAAGGHTCARLDNGQLKCWGYNGFGNLGLGDTVNRGDSGAAGHLMGDALPAVNLGMGRTAVALAAGGFHTCARLDNGQLKCWGYNGFGNLGLGDTVNRGDLVLGMGDMLLPVDLGTIVPVALAVTQQPSNATLGQVLPVQPIFTIRDAGNATVINDNTTQVTLALQGGVGALTCTGGNTTTAVNGVVAFAGCAVSAVGTYTLLAISSPTLPPVSTSSFVISGKLGFTQQPSSATVGQVLPTQPVVAIQDLLGATVANDQTTQVTLTLQGGAGVLTCTGGTTKTAVNGLTTFAGCAVSTAGTYTLLATSSPALTQATSSSFVISLPVSKLGFTQQPSNANVGQALPVQPVVAIQDTGDGTVLSDNTTQVTLFLQGGVGVLTCSGGTTKTAANGLATFAGCAVSAAGTYTLLATSNPVLTPMTSNSFVISVVPAACSGPAIIILAVGANGEVFCGAQLPLTTPLPPGPLPDVVTAIFSWSNAIQRFDFWFRGFPNSFQTLANIGPGNFYFFQSTGAGQIANTGGALRAESRAMNIGPTTAGANGAIWSGTSHALDTLDSYANITAVTAIFSWNNTLQQFNCWFRGFPDSFQTLTGGIEPGNYYFFQTPAGQTIAMN
jgi:alpha-tubulin suppressor-like RCC1 family protein